MSSNSFGNAPSEFICSLFDKVRAAQRKFSTFPQEKVDRIFKESALAANKMRIPLAKMAVEETGMGVFEDKVIKNNYAAEYIYNAYKNTQTCGIISRDNAFGTMTIAEPMGVIAAVAPITNPTSTAIFKSLISLKTRNGIVICPHPRAKKSTVEACKIVLEAAVKAGAPENIIGWIETPSVELTNLAMKEADLILATGGPGMVKAAYSSGKPAVGVGAGNVPVVIDKSADIISAVSSIIHSKTFDNGVICASEQAVIVHSDIYDQVREEFIRRGCFFAENDDLEKLRSIILKNNALNADIVGQSAFRIAEIAGITVPENTKILIGETSDFSLNEPLAHEKLSPVLAFYKAKDFDLAINIADSLVRDGGFGHTAAVYINETVNRDLLERFSHRMKTCRILVNTPSSHGGIGDLYNFNLSPSLTLGCGSWGGNSVSENVGVKHLLNYKTVAERRENMLWFRAPEKVYFKRGCLPVALRELKDKKKIFIVTDSFLFNSGFIKCVTDRISDYNIPYNIFSNVEPDPTLNSALKGAKAMSEFNPDCIIAVGGGSAMDAAKIMWVLYEHPDADFHNMAVRFADIRKRVYSFPKLGEKAQFIAIPTSSGTGSEVTPFAGITDEKTGVKYPVADYELMPDMAVVDADLMMSQPKSLTAASGIDALTHALEAYASVMASDFTDGLALTAIKNIFKYLPSAYQNGSEDTFAREKMANASTLAGMAFGNAFLGLCHSMAHKLGAFHHLPHGVANALLIEEIMKFNISEAPSKMGTFSQYKYPNTLERYAEIADFLGINGNNTEKFNRLLSKIRELKSLIGIKNSIKDYGINEEEFMSSLDEMCLQAFDDQCTGANPRYPLITEIKQIYLSVFHGGNC